MFVNKQMSRGKSIMIRILNHNSLGSWYKSIYNLRQDIWNKVNKSGQLGSPIKSNIFFCKIFDWYCQSFISGGEAKYRTIYHSSSEILLIFPNFHIMPIISFTCRKFNLYYKNVVKFEILWQDLYALQVYLSCCLSY